MENDNSKKDVTKEKIILFIIGVLVGAVISTVAFFVYAKTLGINSNSGSSSQQIPSGTPPEKPSGDNSDSNQGGTPPEKPSNNNTSEEE